MLNVKKKIKKLQSGRKKEEKKVSKKDAGFNAIGFPHDDPYGLAEAWWKIFTKPTEKNVTNKKSKTRTKYESGSGWPSFFESLPGVFETKIDNLIGTSRTEYHCKKCGGHHGHIFDDGPKPTGKRYCNNGLCLVFVPKK